MRGEPNKDATRTFVKKIDAVAGAAAAITIAAVTGVTHVIESVEWSYSATPSGGKLTIAPTSGAIFEIDIPAAGQDQFIFEPGIHGLISEAVVVTLAAGGGAVQGKLNVTYR